MQSDRKPCSLDNARAELKQHLKNLQSSFVNFIFILDMQGSAWRKRALVIATFLLWTLLALFEQNGWLRQLGLSIQYILSFGEQIQNPLSDLENLIFSAYFSPWVLQIIAIFVAPMLIAFRVAYLYLADIYELDDETIAARFVWQTALGGTYDTLTIKEGQISDEDQKSTIFKIGGPGRIKVDLYSAALFEKSNGRPRVIGPTFSSSPKKSVLKKLIDKFLQKIFKKPGGTVIEAFERIKYVKDLRDEILEPIDISARTREGIKITAKDVRMVFSVWRGNPTEEELKAIYPYSKRAVPQFFYSRSSTVGSLKSLPFLGISSFQIPTASPMRGTVQGELGSFISNNTLGDFLTAVGEPEKLELKERAKKYQKEKDEIDRAKEKSEEPSGDRFKTPDFIERDQINPLFNEFADEFSYKNRKNGISLYWLGTGSWVTPDPIIKNKHMEAWELSKENAKSGTTKKLKEAQNKEKNDEFLRLVRKVPLGSARIIYAPNTYREAIIQETLANYSKIIRDAKNLLDIHRNGVRERDILKAINNISRNAHWLGNASFSSSTTKEASSETPPAKPEQAVKEALREAVQVKKDPVVIDFLRDLRRRALGDNEKVIRLIAHEKEKNPNLPMVTLLQNAIDRWIDDIN